MIDNKKCILFSINSEFALLVFLMYYEKLREQNLYPIWLFLKSNEARFKSVDLNSLPGENYIFSNNLNSFKLRPELGFMQIVSKYSIVEFAHQNPYYLSNQLIESTLKKINHNLYVTYVSDSIGLNVKTSLYVKLVSNMYLTYRRFINGLFSLPIFIPIPIKYVNFVDAYINAKKIEGCPTKFLPLERIFSFAKNSKYIDKVFKLSLSKNFEILFFTQPILEHTSFSASMKNEYLKIISFISDMAKKHRKLTLIKVHPAEKNSNYRKYENEYCFIFDNNNIPAELLFNFYRDKKVLSCFSGISSMDFNKRNHHFWLYPMLDYDPKYKINYSDIELLYSYGDLEKEIKCSIS